MCSPKNAFISLKFFSDPLATPGGVPDSNPSVNTSEAVGIMGSMWFRESCLIAKSIDCLDTRFRAPTPFTRGHNGVANTSISKPARTAVIQTIIPCGIQLASGG